MVERFKKRRIPGPFYLYDYTVTGRGHFPFDMLRYDGAWPADSDSAAKLDYDITTGREVRSVHLRSYREPEIAQWSSFMWSVSKYKVEE